MTINNKSERNYRGKCLGSPVTSYGGGMLAVETAVIPGLYLIAFVDFNCSRKGKLGKSAFKVSVSKFIRRPTHSHDL